MTDRFADLRQIAQTLNVDAVVLVPGPNFTRALGRSFSSHERPFLIAVPPAGAPVAIVPNLELRSWGLVKFDGTVFDWRDQTGYADAFAALAGNLPLRRIAVEGQVMRVFVHHALKHALPDCEILDAEQAISALRLLKTDDDIVKMQAAIDISERALTRVLRDVRIGQTEKQIEQMLTSYLFAEGADEHAFHPIVAAADGSAQSHAQARPDYAIRAGDALLLDFGARKDGFCADITRTVFIGHATDDARAVYDVVQRANAVGHQVTRPGITAHDIDDAVIGTLEASPFADRIRTKTGHGLGREVHESPYIVRGNAQVMQAGMVFTNEPGLYREGEFGVRIEDDILITTTGCRSLTSFPRDLMLVGG
jgi:Xaa-Pro dipeptidase